MLIKLAELLVFGFVPLAVGALALPGIAGAEERTVAGEVTYRERIALPPQAVVTVEFVDVSLAGAPGAVIGTQEIRSPGQVPIAFSIKYDTAVLQAETKYALQARITVDNELWFTNEARQNFDPMSNLPVSLLVKQVRASSLTGTATTTVQAD